MIADKATFHAALVPVVKLARDNKIIPILNHVVLAQEGGELLVRGSNSDDEIIVRIKAEFDDEFEPIACPAHQLGEFVKHAPGTEIRMVPVKEDGKITSVNVSSGRSKLRLLTLRADDLPSLESGPLEHGFTCDGQILAKALKAVIYAVDDDKTRPYLHGAFIEPTPEGLVVVATDGHRLVRRLVPIMVFDDDAALDDIKPVILPEGMVSRLLAVIGDGHDLTLQISPVKIRAIVGDLVMVSKLLDLTYPDYRRVIPAKGASRVEFSVPALDAALTRVALTAPEKKGVLFSFSPGMLQLSTANGGIGEGQDAIDVSGDAEVEIGFNWRYTQQLLDNCGADRLQIFLSDPGAPAILHAPDDSENFTVLMPLRV